MFGQHATDNAFARFEASSFVPAANLGLLLAARLTPRYGLRDKISDSWRSGWGSDGDTDDAGVETFEGAYDADADANTDEAVPIYDDEAADRAVALFASALDDDELDRLQVRDVDDEPERIIGLDGKPLDDAIEALNAGPADDRVLLTT